MIWFVFALGLLVGFLIGVVLDDALNLYRASRKEAPMTETGKRRVSGGLVGLLVVICIVQAAVAVLLILQRQSYYEYVACKAEYDQQAAASSGIRLQMAEDVDTAFDDVIKAVAEEDSKGFRVALAKYQDLRLEQKEQRKNLPPPPEKVCGSAEGVRG